MVAVREEGIVELVLSDAGDEINTSVKKYNTAVDFPDIAESTPSERPYLEYGIGRVVNEDEKVKLYFTPVESDRVVAGNSKVSIPVTFKNLTTGSISSGVLTATDFDDWNDAGATGLDVTAGKRTYLGEYVVGAKRGLKLGNYTVKDGLDKSNGRILAVLYDDTNVS
jgi:hypothetical protein